MSRMERGVTTDHVHQVVGIDDRVLRNYWVTQTYADLSVALSTLLGPGTANWCTYATWASCTVGKNLRGENLPGWLRAHLVLPDGMMGEPGPSADPVGGHARHSANVVRELFGACALNLSNGNTIVFSEIAPVAATFIAAHRDPSLDPATARAQVLAAAAGAPEFEGENHLAAGFSLWCDAMAEHQMVRRSQLILAGSLHLGAHEQHHLQDPIAGSIDMGVNESSQSLLQRLSSEGPVMAELARVTSVELRPIVHEVSQLWGDLMTDVLGRIDMPDVILHLSHDVPPIHGQPFVPADLDPVTVDELAALLERFSRAGAGGVGSKAEDWVKLEDRMNFISNLFVSRHHHTRLFDPPFGAGVVTGLEAGEVPGAGGEGRAPAPLSARPAGGPAVTRGPSDPPTVGHAKFTHELLIGLRRLGDEPADAAVAEYFDTTGHGHAHLFHSLVASSHGGPVDDEEMPGVAGFVNALEPWPDWVDPARIERGQQVFGRWGPQLALALWMASLPADYACARGAVSLARTARLTSKPMRRYLETGQMIIDAMTPGGLEPGARGSRTVRHVRVMHAAVRHMLLHPDQLGAGAEDAAGDPVEPWDDALGVPLNQEELLGCLFSFNVVGLDALKRTGVPVDGEDAEDYIHAWNLVGHQIGIHESLLPLDLPDSIAVWDRICRLEYAPSPDGRELTASAIECLQQWLVGPFRGLPAAGIRHYLGNETADLLGVPAADWTRVFFVFMQHSDSLLGQAMSRVPGMGLAGSTLGRLLLEGFLKAERHGDRPQFEISDELRQAWGM